LSFLGSIWARMTGKDVPASGPGTVGAASPGPAPSASNAPARAPGARLDGLALRSAESLGDVFTDPQRLKWVLLQPEADAAARKFGSMARLGEKRADEAREARESLRALLEADLPGESAEHIEMLLDLMQTGARKGMERYVAGDAPPRIDSYAHQLAQADPEFPEAYVSGGPVSQPRLEPEPVQVTAEPTMAAPAGAAAPVAAAASESAAPSAPVAVAERVPPPAPVAAVAPQASATMAPVEYELHILPGTSMADVDSALVREYVQGSMRRRTGSPLNEIGVVDVMHALKAINGPPGQERLTVLGGLYFASRPERLVVQSKVRFVEFPGTEVASSGETVTYRYTEEVTGTIPDLIARMEQIHKERLAPGVLADGFRVEEVPSVPLFALREAMVNAVCHRDYSLIGANIQVRLFADRLEVQSPGGLPGPVTVANILTESYARNPRVADILRDLGYVERHGLGIDNMVQSMKDAHLPPPEFANSETSFTVILRFREPDEAAPETWIADIGALTLAPAKRKGLIFTRRMGSMVSTDYQSLNLVDEAEAATQLRALVRDGWLVQSGTRDSASYTLGPRAGSSPAAETGATAALPAAVLDSLPSAQRRILDIVVRQRKVRASDVLEISGLKDRRTVQRTLATLTERGLLIRRASSRTDPNASYEVNPDFREDGA
jgi:ATP-dependent DNA helicase RecG